MIDNRAAIREGEAEWTKVTGKVTGGGGGAVRSAKWEDGETK